MLETVHNNVDTGNWSFLESRLNATTNWSINQVREAIAQYKNFLFLKKKYGGNYILPPSSDIDKVWHEHILCTQHYSEFCDKFFGFYLHHTPESISKNNVCIETEFAKTRSLYFTEFNEHLYAIERSFLNLKFGRLISFWQKCTFNNTIIE